MSKLSPMIWAPVVGLLAAATAIAAACGVEWYVMSPYGDIGAYAVEFAVGLTFVGAVLGTLLALGLSLVPGLRRVALFAALALGVYAVTLLIGMRLPARVRMHEFGKLAFRSRPLVFAIQHYEAEHGVPPPSLNALAPKYTSRVPGTGIRAYPKYVYATGELAALHEGNRWVLEVSTPSGLLNWDRFVYLPNGKYKEYDYGGVVERVRDWGYYWE
ncbi:MAG: hypothetical protein FJX72_03945 [Armatimonadetes bacterium]|nr:hypothetical protein [Armatimonadota bacterium]